MAEFYAAETQGEDSESSSTVATAQTGTSVAMAKMYRDVNLHLRPKGSEFVCEVQLTLTCISILKKSEQKIYTLERMVSAKELLGAFVFSEHHESVVPRAEFLTRGGSCMCTTTNFERLVLGFIKADLWDQRFI